VLEKQNKGVGEESEYTLIKTWRRDMIEGLKAPAQKKKMRPYKRKKNWRTAKWKGDGASSGKKSSWEKRRRLGLIRKREVRRKKQSEGLKGKKKERGGKWTGQNSGEKKKTRGK